MRKKLTLLLIALLLFAVLLVSGCFEDDEVCNYDGVCTDDETNGCVDCKDVLGRGVQVKPEVQDNMDPKNIP